MLIFVVKRGLLALCIVSTLQLLLRPAIADGAYFTGGC